MAETKTFISVNEILPLIGKLVEEAVEAGLKKRALETYLSTEEVRKLFNPAPSRVHLLKLHKQGILIKHDFNGKQYYKASEVEACIKEIPRLKKVC